MLVLTTGPEEEEGMRGSSPLVRAVTVLLGPLEATAL